MRDINVCRLSGEIFWSKLDDNQSYSTLRLGIKLQNGGTVFCTVSNPSVKEYEIIKAGNKVLITGGYLDTWEKQDGTSELQIKSNDSGIQFFPKEKALSDVNIVTIVGTIKNMDNDTAIMEMVGERNPKTQQWTIRKARIKIGDTYKSISGSKIMIEGKVTSVDVPVTVDGKEKKVSKLVIDAMYDKIIVL